MMKNNERRLFIINLTKKKFVLFYFTIKKMKKNYSGKIIEILKTIVFFS